MTKTLQEIQEENRRLILEGLHSCDYEEALKKEEGGDCCYLYSTPYGDLELKGPAEAYGYNREKHHHNAFVKKIIGRSLTLNRVLLALKKTNITKEYSGQTFEIKLVKGACESEIDIVHDFLGLGFYNFVRWDLTKEALEIQSEETQIAINKLLTA